MYTIQTEIEIDTTPEHVWRVLTDFATYGEWSNFTSIKPVVARGNSEIEVGDQLAMRMPAMAFTSTITLADVHQRLRWTGVIVTPRVFCGHHTFTLEALPGDRTRVINREDFSGVLTWLTQPLMRSDNTGGYGAFNAGLKRRAELLKIAESGQGGEHKVGRPSLQAFNLVSLS